jgi:hypothetical protein
LEESTHTYRTADGRVLASAGSLVKELTPAFDAKAVAAKIAGRPGKPATAAAVLAEWDAKRPEWDAKRDRAAAKGHAIHDFIKLALVTENPAALDLPELGWRECASWLSWWSQSRKSLRIIAHERIVGCLELGFAGTLDSLAASSRTDLAHVLDWKSNEEFETSNRWRNMLPPLNDLPDCHLSHYSVQLSLYRLALERADIPTGDAWIVHLGQQATPYRALDLRRRLEKWLEQRTRNNFTT